MTDSSLLSSLLDALQLLLLGDGKLWSIILVSFKVSSLAMLVAALPAVICGFLLAYMRFPGRRLLISLFNTLLAVPAVVVGLTFYILLSRHGPLGDWKLLFTQTAMVLGQIALCFPIMVAMSHAAFQAIDLRAWETARTIGAGTVQAFMMIVSEARYAILGAFVAGFGRIIAEVGASMMLGGNILHYTRNIPTAIALETSKGELSQGIALGIVLVTLSFLLVSVLHYFQGRGQIQ